MYNFQFQYPRCGAVCPGMFLPVLMTLGKCFCFRAKAAHISRSFTRYFDREVVDKTKSGQVLRRRVINQREEWTAQPLNVREPAPSPASFSTVL